MPKKTLEQEINEFIDVWDFVSIGEFLQDVMPIIQVYDVEDREITEDLAVVSLVRTVYLMSKLADKYAGKLSMVNVKYKKLWQKMENVEGLETE